VRALVVGAGRMGGLHRRVLRDLGYDVTTVDPDPSAGADYLTSPPRARANVDVVCIATPLAELAESAARWTGFGGHLLIEKPMAGTLDDALLIQAALGQQRVAVGYVERFNPQVLTVRKVLESRAVEHVRFRRHNDRPTSNMGLDLMSHDIDLAAFLGLRCPVTFDTHASGCRFHKVRAVDVNDTVTIDLMAHDTSPLHAQWHAFLSGRSGYATPADAVHVLRVLELQRLPAAA